MFLAFHCFESCRALNSWQSPLQNNVNCVHVSTFSMNAIRNCVCPACPLSERGLLVVNTWPSLKHRNKLKCQYQLPPFPGTLHVTSEQKLPCAAMVSIDTSRLSPNFGFSVVLSSAEVAFFDTWKRRLPEMALKHKCKAVHCSNTHPLRLFPFLCLTTAWLLLKPWSFRIWLIVGRALHILTPSCQLQNS